MSKQCEDYNKLMADVTYEYSNMGRILERVENLVFSTPNNLNAASGILERLIIDFRELDESILDCKKRNILP
jgi:hypothetical protein